MDIRFRYVHQDKDRHGNVRVYFWRRPGPKIRIHEPPGSEAFAARYQQLLNGPVATPNGGPARPEPRSFRWLVAAYVASPAFLDLDGSTQSTRRRVLESCCKEPVKMNVAGSLTVAQMPLARVNEHTVRMLRDRKHDLPGAASDRVKALRGLFSWACEAEGTGIVVNPARDLKRRRYASGGHTMWSIDDVEAFEAHHPIGSKARLALAFLLYTGMRRSDISQIGRQHVSRSPVAGYAGWISKPQWKGRKRQSHKIELPLLQPLADIIDATDTANEAAGKPQGLAFLLTEYGQPFTIPGFGNWFHDRCIESGLVNRSAHGLRKAASTRAAEAGATAHQLMGMFGWKSLAEAELYTRAADRKRLSAEGGMALLPARIKNTVVPTMTDGENKRSRKA